MVYIDHGIYARSLPLLRNAFGIERDANTRFALAQMYQAAGNPANYRQVIQEIIDDGELPDGMSLADVYMLAVEHDMVRRRPRDVIEILRMAIYETGDVRFRELYEERRYAFSTRPSFVDWAGLVWGGAALGCVPTIRKCIFVNGFFTDSSDF